MNEAVGGSVVSGLVDTSEHVGWRDEDGHAHMTPCTWEDKKKNGW